MRFAGGAQTGCAVAHIVLDTHVLEAAGYKLQHGKPLLVWSARPIACPSGGARVGGKREQQRAGFLARCVPCPCLAQVEANVGALPQGDAQSIGERPGAVGRARHVDIVKEGIEILAGAQLPVRLEKRRVLPKGIQSRHERVALLASFSLRSVVRDPVLLVEKVRARLRVELGYERQEGGQARIALRAVQHAGPWDVVKRPDPIHTEHGGARIDFTGRPQSPGKGFGAGPGPKRVLERRASRLEGACVLLREGPRRDAPEHVAHDQAARSAVGLLQAHHPAQAHARKHGRRHRGSRERFRGGEQSRMAPATRDTLRALRDPDRRPPQRQVPPHSPCAGSAFCRTCVAVAGARRPGLLGAPQRRSVTTRPAVNAALAAQNSPRWASAAARSARRWPPLFAEACPRELGRGSSAAAAAVADSNKQRHCPAASKATLAGPETSRHFSRPGSREGAHKGGCLATPPRRPRQPSGSAPSGAAPGMSAPCGGVQRQGRRLERDHPGGSPEPDKGDTNAS